MTMLTTKLSSVNSVILNPDFLNDRCKNKDIYTYYFSNQSTVGM